MPPADPLESVQATIKATIKQLRAKEQARLAEANKLPYHEKGILVANSYLRALEDLEHQLETPPPVVPPAVDVEPVGKVHELKCWPEYFAALADGRKRFELRKDDRGFALGDCLRLREWEPKTSQYSGRELFVRVTFITLAFMGEGCVALGIEPVPQTDEPAEKDE